MPLAGGTEPIKETSKKAIDLALCYQDHADAKAIARCCRFRILKRPI